MQKTINGATLRKMFLAGAALLDENKAYIDSLNVFPVPDGDTGINMSLTLKSVVKELGLTDSNEINEIAESVSRGALKGARGNSGVITSQILKGFCMELKASNEITTKTIARALDNASRVAYGAVTSPKEGTMLTVIRLMAEAALPAAKKMSNLEEFISHVIEKGEEALAQTPELLPVLKKAGVVDAGGRGVLVFFSGFYKVLIGDEELVLKFEKDVLSSSTGSFSDVHVDLDSLADIEFAFCTEFMIVNMHKKTTLASIDVLRDKLVQMGDSVICIGDLELVKVHIHTNTPGEALSQAQKLGEIINIKIDNMVQQNRELREANKVEVKELGMVAVAAGEGLSAIFKDLMCDYVIKGGQTMNPSANDIAEAVNKVNAKNVFVFPNNKNIILAAQHAAELTKKNIIVIPTRSINEGITACLTFNPEGTIEDNTESFLSAITTVKSCSVTHAVRSTNVDGLEISENDYIGLNNKNILVNGKKLNDVTKALIEKQIDDSTMNITLFYGDKIETKEADALAEEIAKKYPNCDVNAINGGQPVYYYLISLE
ncbi:MAG: DAK2 domain-containing protein [Firmicutes bacterium]|nr:DAK2 domain-containing protein [Bacillota bacterium]